MLFGCEVEVFSDEQGQYYAKVVFDDTTVNLDYYLIDSDIKEINEIRQYIRKFLATEKYFLKYSGKNIWMSIKLLLS